MQYSSRSDIVKYSPGIFISKSSLRSSVLRTLKKSYTPWGILILELGGYRSGIIGLHVSWSCKTIFPPPGLFLFFLSFPFSSLGRRSCILLMNPWISPSFTLYLHHSPFWRSVRSVSLTWERTKDNHRVLFVFGFVGRNAIRGISGWFACFIASQTAKIFFFFFLIRWLANPISIANTVLLLPTVP